MNSILKRFGWHFTAQQVSEWTGITFFEVLERSAIEILTIISIMQAKGEYNNLIYNK